jgi:hypothetical protein
MGYVFIACGIFAATYSLSTLVLIIPGLFMAFTYTGTIIDSDNKRVRPYTSLFGIIRTGKWINTQEFTRFRITRLNKRYTTYSRGSVRFDMDINYIVLQLINSDGTSKVDLNRYRNIEEAQKEMEELTGIFMLENIKKLPTSADKHKKSVDA